MPANLSDEGTFYHVFNRGVEKRVIFSDTQDYEAFRGFLSDYLLPPADPESTKKVFIVNGQSFKGTPHQPKNYFGKIELVAYSLMPNHFHLILHQKNKGSLESFIRSLCTRYSMYFNKKHHRTGSLFEGPYKSVQVDNRAHLWPLASHIHHGTNEHSSYLEYSGKKSTPWLSTDVVLSEHQNPASEKAGDLPKELVIEGSSQETKQLERRDLEVSHPHSEAKRPNAPAILSSFAIFAVLFGLGLRNINVTRIKNVASAPTTKTEVLSESTTNQDLSEPSTESTTAKRFAIVKTTNGSENINIRQSPSIDSEKIGTAANGESFEIISENAGWYEVKLKDGSSGFILTSLTYIQETVNQ